MEPNRQRLVDLVAEARKAVGLTKQADFVKATGLSKSTVHRFETEGKAGKGSMRTIAWTIRWTPDSPFEVLAGGEPTPLPVAPEARQARDLEVGRPEGEWVRRQGGPNDLVIALDHIVMDIVTYVAPDMTAAQIRELQERTRRTAEELGFDTRRRRLSTHTDDDPEN